MNQDISTPTSPFPELAPAKYRYTAGKHLGRIFTQTVEEDAPDDEVISDPIGEKSHIPVPFLIRKFQDRALFLASNKCSIHCRFCFRRASGLFASRGPNSRDLQNAVDWVRRTEAINEVILSGGDPLALAPDSLFATIKAFSALPNISKIRIHTRRPVVDVQNGAENLYAAQKHCSKPLSVVLHIAHPDEITEELTATTKKLTQEGISTSSQTVLLANVNDNQIILRELFTKLSEASLPSRYLHHPDRVSGAAHFRVSLARGLELLRAVGNVAGVPPYVIDLPNGSGKTPVNRLAEIGCERIGDKIRKKYRWTRPEGWDGVSKAQSYEWWDIWTRCP